MREESAEEHLKRRIRLLKKSQDRADFLGADLNKRFQAVLTRPKYTGAEDWDAGDWPYAARCWVESMEVNELTAKVTVKWYVGGGDHEYETKSWPISLLSLTQEQAALHWKQIGDKKRNDKATAIALRQVKERADQEAHELAEYRRLNDKYGHLPYTSKE